MNLFVCRSLFISLVVYTSMVFSTFDPIMAQENAYPLQMSEGKKSHRPAVPGVNGLVTAGHPLASMAGLRILMAGGNAIDASVAVLATLNVFGLRCRAQGEMASLPISITTLEMSTR